MSQALRRRIQFDMSRQHAVDDAQIHEEGDDVRQQAEIRQRRDQRAGKAQRNRTPMTSESPNPPRTRTPNNTIAVAPQPTGVLKSHS